MISATSFVNELVRAANEVGALNGSEVTRLLDRAVRTVLEMREQVGIPQSNSPSDAVLNLQAVAAAVADGRQSVESVRVALLDAAAMIRDLRIVIVERIELVLSFPSGDSDQLR